MQEPFVLFLARTDHQQLHAPLHQAFADVAEQVDALVAGKARDHDRQRAVGILVQTDGPLERQLVGRLAGLPGLGRVFLRQSRALVRPEQLHIDAVGNAGEGVSARGQHTGKTVRIIRIPQLLAVCFRDGIDAICRNDGSLHEVRAVVKAQKLVAAGWKAQHIIVEVQAAFALILDVVDGKDALRVRERRVVLRPEQQRDQRRLPVVAVDHIRLQADEAHRRQNGLAEKREALSVVRLAVDPRAAEIVLIVDKINFQLLFPGLEPENADIFAPPRQRHIEIPQKFLLEAVVVFDRAVKRQKYAHLVLGNLGQRLRQRLHHVAKAAGFEKRRGLGGGHCYFHMTAPLLMTSG